MPEPPLAHRVSGAASGNEPDGHRFFIAHLCASGATGVPFCPQPLSGIKFWCRHRAQIRPRGAAREGDAFGFVVVWTLQKREECIGVQFRRICAIDR